MSLTCLPPQPRPGSSSSTRTPTPQSLIDQALCFVPAESRIEARLQLLEAAAAKLGNFDYAWYRETISTTKDIFIVDVRHWAPALAEALQAGPVHPALALCRLTEPELPPTERRRAGSYYTDFRLATHLGSRLRVRSSKGRVPLILDPASGTGVLLVAAVLAVSGGDPSGCDALVGRGVHAADLSAAALRGAALALSSLARGRRSVAALLGRLRQGDSLSKGSAWWRDIAPEGFDFVVGNPPWEKLKVSRHEHLRSHGVERHYGTDYDTSPQVTTSWQEARQRSADYHAVLSEDYDLQGCGDPDLYKLFLELMLKLLRSGGELGAYVPAGLIRSLGCGGLRQRLLDRAEEIECCVFENRARFFAIDTRFKFVGLRVQTKGVDGSCDGGPLLLSHATGTPDGVKENVSVPIERSVLSALRSDLSLPEVKTLREWEIFQAVTAQGTRIGDLRGVWQPHLLREVDMTNNRGAFLDFPAKDALPLIEGRMIHQFNHSAKQYVGGRGRSALWQPALVAGPTRCLVPQFWYPAAALSEGTRRRVMTARIGFCDITGQTNERTMLAARVPAGVACGNKVPTILFPNAGSAVEQRQSGDLWLAVFNSLVFDWMLRRVVTTTVNYFLLLDLPFPKEEHISDARRRLQEISCQLSGQEKEVPSTTVPQGWAAAELRAEADWRVLAAYGQSVVTLETLLEDFPLLDRSQPSLPGEERSTITKDFVLLRAAQALGEVAPERVTTWERRAVAARSAGAVPYVPTHLDVSESTGQTAR